MFDKLKTFISIADSLQNQYNYIYVVSADLDKDTIIEFTFFKDPARKEELAQANLNLTNIFYKGPQQNEDAFKIYMTNILKDFCSSLSLKTENIESYLQHRYLEPRAQPQIYITNVITQFKEFYGQDITLKPDFTFNTLKFYFGLANDISWQFITSKELELYKLNLTSLHQKYEEDFAKRSFILRIYPIPVQHVFNIYNESILEVFLKPELLAMVIDELKFESRTIMIQTLGRNAITIVEKSHFDAYAQDWFRFVTTPFFRALGESIDVIYPTAFSLSEPIELTIPKTCTLPLLKYEVE